MHIFLMAPFTLSDAAVARIIEINAMNHKNERLRVAVQGGGCAGFQYTFLMDDACQSDDHIFERDGASLIIDEVSLSLLEGSMLDYQDDLAASMFIIKNPKATSGCGCGNSFSL